MDTLKQRMKARAKMRLVAGGAWHNLVFWCLLFVFGSVGRTGWLWALVGYEDAGELGRVVMGFDEVRSFYTSWVLLTRCFVGFTVARSLTSRDLDYGVR